VQNFTDPDWDLFLCQAAWLPNTGDPGAQTATPEIFGLIKKHKKPSFHWLPTIDTNLYS
jgi:hypothetical protein